MALIYQNLKNLTEPMEGANLSVLQSFLDQVDSGKLDYYAKQEDFKLEVKLSNFNLLSIDTVMYNKINLPFQVTVFNNTFMKTRIFRLVSRKIPNTINQISNIELPLDIEIGESQSYMIYLSIDSLDDIDWLVNNDLAFLMYSDNTTLSEIDFAIRVPDIRGITGYTSFKDNTLDLDDQYLSGLTDFEEIVTKAFKLDDDAALYSKLKDIQTLVDLSPDLTYGQEALSAVLADIWEHNKLKDLQVKNMPADFAYNLINLRESRTFRNKMKFNVLRFKYYDGIISQDMSIGFDDAKELFNSWKAANQSVININLENTDTSTQKSNLDGLIFMLRIPFFGSTYMYYDIIFYVINIRKRSYSVVIGKDIGSFTGDFIRLSELYSEDPSISDLVLQYDISSQVKENLTAFKTIEAREYAKTPDATDTLGFKIVNVEPQIILSGLIDLTDITVSYYHTNPIESYKNNQIIYEHSEDFRTKLITYDQYTYFGIDSTELFPDNSIDIYSTDCTLQKQKLHDVDNTWTYSGVDYTIANTISISISNEIKNSFKILSTENISNGASTLVLGDTTKDLDIVYIDKIEIFNNGNTFITLSDINLLLPNGKYSYVNKQENKYGSDMIKQDMIANDTEFYKSMFDPETPIEVMAFNTLTPGETGDLYIVYRLNRSLLKTYLAEFFKIPIYLRIEFNENMSAYFCHIPTEEFGTIARYNEYTLGSSLRSEMGKQDPYWQQMFTEKELPPSDQWNAYAHVDSIIDADGIYQKNLLQHDIAFYADATVESNKTPGVYIDMGEKSPSTTGCLGDGQMTPFSQLQIMPIPVNSGKIQSVNDILSLYDMVSPNDINYNFYIMNFNSLFYELISDIKNNYWLVTLAAATKIDSQASSDKVIYFRYDLSNQYSWYDYELESYNRHTKPIMFSQISDLNVQVKIFAPETQLNTFECTIPRPLEFVETSGLSQDMFAAGIAGTSDAEYDTQSGIVEGAKTSKTKRQYFRDRYHHVFDFGEIVGNKILTMSIITSWFNLFRIKSFDNFEISNQSVGPGLPDTYTLKIVKPDLEYARIIFEFMKMDYTTDFTQEHKIEETIAQNAGNYVITPSYFDLEYIPIDETYAVAVSITNQNPYQVSLSMLPSDAETNNAIQLIQFPNNAEYNKMYLYLRTMGKPYTLLPNETVKMFFRIIPRRIGMNFFTVYLKLNNSIRPINFEFRSFINKKAYFVLDSASKVVDFGDVPIGKYVEEPVIVKNIGSVLGKINSIYTFGNDAKWFKLLDRDHGNELAERITYNKVVKPKTTLSLPIRFFSQSYGFNYSYCYIETNEPVLEDAQQYDYDFGEQDFTELYRNTPKYLVSLLKANSVIEDEIIETDSYIFLGYVNPLRSKFRNYEVTINNKNRNKVVSVFKVTNLMKNYVKIKYTREPFDKSSSIWIQLNPRAYTEGWYYDEMHIWMIVYDKKTKTNKFVLNKIPISQYVTREQRLSFDVDLEEITFVSKPFMKSFKKVNIRNYSNEDATMFLNMLTDCSGLFTIIPDLSNQDVIIPEGVNFTFMLAFGGDQRFIGKYDTMVTIRFTLGGEVITKYVPVMGLVGDENVVKFYKRNRIIVS